MFSGTCRRRAATHDGRGARRSSRLGGPAPGARAQKSGAAALTNNKQTKKACVLKPPCTVPYSTVHCFIQSNTSHNFLVFWKKKTSPAVPIDNLQPSQRAASHPPYRVLRIYFCRRSICQRYPCSLLPSSRAPLRASSISVCFIVHNTSLFHECHHRDNVCHSTPASVYSTLRTATPSSAPQATPAEEFCR